MGNTKPSPSPYVQPFSNLFMSSQHEFTSYICKIYVRTIMNNLESKEINGVFVLSLIMEFISLSCGAGFKVLFFKHLIRQWFLLHDLYFSDWSRSEMYVDNFVDLYVFFKNFSMLSTFHLVNDIERWMKNKYTLFYFICKKILYLLILYIFYTCCYQQLPPLSNGYIWELCKNRGSHKNYLNSVYYLLRLTM